jgi:hypothetical protein
MTGLRSYIEALDETPILLYSKRYHKSIITDLHSYSMEANFG